jgi:uncharacterized protein YidB (DUF937 family)
MLSSIIDNLKDQVGPEILNKTGLSEDKLPQIMDIVADASKNVVGNQVASGNMGSLMNLFGSGSNSKGADGIQSALTDQVVSGLAQKLGLSESVANTISSIVVPQLIGLITKKNSETPDDDDSPITELFGGGGDLMEKAKKGLGGLF